MTEGHPDDATLVAWTEGTLDGDAAAALERHIVGCMHCGVRLEQCARLDEQMREAAAYMRGTPRARPRQRPSMPAGLALAASLVLGLGMPGRWVSFDGVDPFVGGASQGGSTMQATPWREAPTCAVEPEPGDDLCDDPTTGLDGALAMSMPETDDDHGDDLCVDDGEGARLACGVGELVSG